MPLRMPAVARPARACATCGQALPARTRKHVLHCRLCAALTARAFYLAALATPRDRRRDQADEDV